MASTGTAVTLTLGAALAAGWATTLGKAKGDVGLLGRAIAKNQEQQRGLGAPDIESHKRNTDALAASKKALQSYQEQAHKGGVMTEEQTAILAHLTKEHDKAQSAYDKSKKAIDARSIALKAEGKDVDAVIAKSKQLETHLLKQVALGKAVAEVRQRGSSLLKTVGAGVGILSAATATAYKFVNATAAEGDALNNTSARLGVAVSSLQELNFVADRAGLGAGGLEKGLDNLGRGLDDAIIKKSGPVHEALQRLGLDARAIATMPADERLNAISDALSLIGDESARASITADLFGAGSGGGFNTLLAGGSASLAGRRSDARASGAVYDTKGAREYQDSLAALKSSWTSLGRIVGAQLMPAFTRLNKTLGAAITGNGGQVGKAVAALADVFTNLVPVLGAAAKVAASFFGVLGKSPWIVKTLAVALGAVGAAIGIIKFALFIKSVVMMGAALIGFIPIVWAFTASLLACPITWIVIGLVAIGAAIFFLWKKWDAINAWFDAHPFLGAIISAAFPVIGAIRLVVKAIGYLRENWGAVTSALGTAWEAIKTIFSWSPLGVVIKAYGVMFKWLEDKFGIFTKIGAAFSKVKGWFGGGKKTDADPAAAAAAPTAIDTTIPVSRGGNNTVNNSIGKIEVTAPPGVSAEEVANLTVRKINEQQSAMLDGALADPA